jgi:hypothetical protein
MAQFYKCFIKNYYGIYYEADYKNKDLSLDKGVLEGLGVDQIKVY